MVNQEFEEPDIDGLLMPFEEGDDDENYNVLGLDPGGTTGWGLFGVHPEAMGPDPGLMPFGPPSNVLYWSAGEFTGSQDSQVDQILELCEAWPNARLVTEDFQLRTLAAQLDPVEINAIVLRATRPRYWVKQMPSLAMGVATDERLKAAGFWIPGKPHARDAARHCITFIKRTKEKAIKAGRARWA
jgi:hypothetical protein